MGQGMSESGTPTTLSDADLLAQFEALSLPFDRWTHRAHVRVAYLYLSRHPFEEAAARLSKNIRAYNAHNIVPEGPTSGYNETTTRAFAHLIAATMHAYGTAFPTADSEAFCDTHPQLMTRHVLRFFYSPERRMDPRAKSSFVEPDLAPLPKMISGAEMHVADTGFTGVPTVASRL